MTKLTTLITADGKVVDVYAEDDATSEEEYDDVLCFWCEKDIDEYEDDAFYHSTTNAWYCEDCYTFMLENE
jgi:hypothetical protein